MSSILTGSTIFSNSVAQGRPESSDRPPHGASGNAIVAGNSSTSVEKRGGFGLAGRMGADNLDLLTKRERECLHLVGRGRSSKEIAAELGLAPNSVDTYIANACQKLGITGRRQAARLLEQPPAPPSEKFGYELPGLADTAVIDEPMPQRNEGAPRLRLPFLRQGRQFNVLDPGQRLAWIGGLAIIILVTVANFLNGMATLLRVVLGIR